MQNKTTPQISPKLVWTMAVACGLTVANLYYNQPLLGQIKHSLGVSVSAIGLIPFFTQLGYAIGLLGFVPLGDFIQGRKLIVGLLALESGSLMVASISSNLFVLSIATFAIGVFTVIPQILIPLAANLAPPDKRGQIVGLLMGGLLVGILLARTLSGFIGSYYGWRLVYIVAAIIMFLLIGILYKLLPEIELSPSKGYLTILKSLWEIVWSEKTIRESSLYGAMGFGAFSAFWATLIFLVTTPPYHYGVQEAGLFGLVGVVGAIAAPLVGKIADKKGPLITIGISLTIITLSFVVLMFFGYNILGLIIGVILLDLGVQANQVSNQTRIYAIGPKIRNRLTTIYMFSYFIGGAAGSYFAAFAWSVDRWQGVTFVGIVFMAVAILRFIISIFSKNTNDKAHSSLTSFSSNS